MAFSNDEEILTLSGDFAEKIWVPDTFFANDKNRLVNVVNCIRCWAIKRLIEWNFTFAYQNFKIKVPKVHAILLTFKIFITYHHIYNFADIL